jgi:hypothetical protein
MESGKQVCRDYDVVVIVTVTDNRAASRRKARNISLAEKIKKHVLFARMTVVGRHEFFFN